MKQTNKIGCFVSAWPHYIFHSFLNIRHKKVKVNKKIYKTPLYAHWAQSKIFNVGIFIFELWVALCFTSMKLQEQWCNLTGCFGAQKQNGAVRIAEVFCYALLYIYFLLIEKVYVFVFDVWYILLLVTTHSRKLIDGKLTAWPLLTSSGEELEIPSKFRNLNTNLYRVTELYLLQIYFEHLWKVYGKTVKPASEFVWTNDKQHQTKC